MEDCPSKNVNKVETDSDPQIIIPPSNSSELDGLDFGSFIRCDNPDDEFVGDPKLIAIIGDEDTCVGFILAGIGEIDENLTPNYIVVDNNTDEYKLELKFLDMLERNDIGLILITKEAAVKLGHVLKHYKGLDPTVMIIPGHNGPYEFELPLAVKDIEDRRKSHITSADSRRGSIASNASLKSVESHHTVVSKKFSSHSLRSNLSVASLKL